MSPRSATRPPTPAAAALASRVAMGAGAVIGEQRRRKALTARQLADRARVSPATVNAAEAGRRVSLDAYARLATALGLSLDLVIGDQRKPKRLERGDFVHAAMGEFEARWLSRLGHQVSIDHPYQHYQFAGRADVLAWSGEGGALLHIENRTRFPDLQEAAGSFNAKRQYLASVVSRQLGLRGFKSQTHVMVGLWSAEVLHAIRARPASFRALCPDPADAWLAWLSGRPVHPGSTSTFVLLDPLATGRQRTHLGLEDALSGARPRVRGYADAAARLRALGRV